MKRWKDEQNLTFEIEVDGGINDETAKQCVEKGVDVLVAGSYIFNNKNREQAIEMIRTRVSEVQ